MYIVDYACTELSSVVVVGNGRQPRMRKLYPHALNIELSSFAFHNLIESLDWCAIMPWTSVLTSAEQLLLYMSEVVSEFYFPFLIYIVTLRSVILFNILYVYYYAVMSMTAFLYTLFSAGSYRWIDIPFTREESLQADKTFKLNCEYCQCMKKIAENESLFLTMGVICLM